MPWPLSFTPETTTVTAAYGFYQNYRRDIDTEIEIDIEIYVATHTFVCTCICTHFFNQW